ncbi:lytic murein transglycosylase [Patescibacteria group bacterium]|nr:lytic murein transglycosylase [Patescibacteria group bacterium]MBU4512750.1 lytic murein transglycosylase [Patescibacteria group bacterium]MCG2693090.1 lytic murein transglycosylase [Candidatus Parcubacteria bacterium]
MKTLGLFFCLLLLAPASWARLDSAERAQDWEDQKQDKLLRDLEKEGFSRGSMVALLSDSSVKFYPYIYQKFEAARKRKDDPYKPFFTEKSIGLGKDFIRQNQALLAEVEAKFGVEKEILVALLRIESCFGENQGSYQVFGVFVSLVRYGEARVGWATKELIAFLKMCCQQNWDPLAINSSYAGALGIPQFMPTSYWELAVDGDGDKKIDLFNLKDAVHSMANFLAKRGWQRDQQGSLRAYNRDSLFVSAIERYAQKMKE